MQDKQILINQNKKLKHSQSENINKLKQSNIYEEDKQYNQMLTQYKFSEQFEDDDTSQESQDDKSSQKSQKLLFNSSEEENEDENENNILVTTFNQTMIDQKNENNQKQQKQQQQEQQQQQQRQLQQEQQQQQQQQQQEQNEQGLNKFLTHSIKNEEFPYVIDDFENPFENKINFENNQLKYLNNIHSNENTFLYENENDNFILQKFELNRGSDPIDFDCLNEELKNDFQSENQIKTQNFLSNNQQNQQNTHRNIVSINNKVENPFVDGFYSNNFQNILNFKNQQILQKSEQISDSFISNQDKQNLIDLEMNQSAYQSFEQTTYLNDYSKQKYILNQEQRQKNSLELFNQDVLFNINLVFQDDKKFQNSKQLYQQNQEPQTPCLSNFQSLKENEKNSIQNQNQSHCLQEILDQFEDFKENNIDSMSDSEEFYDNEEYEQDFQEKFSNYKNKLNKTYENSTLKKFQLNLIKEEDQEEENSHLRFCKGQSSILNTNSYYNDFSTHDQFKVEKNYFQSENVESFKPINPVKNQINLSKAINQIQRLFEIKKQKILKCQIDEVGYLKDANGFYIFDIEGKMIKVDKEEIIYLQNENYIQLF